jgi:hypothetical protein
MYSVYDTRCRVGCPIRISTDQRLLAAPRGFSQRATSFIASWCQGIHRMPFLYSISKTTILRSPSTMHRNHPQESVVSFPSSQANCTQFAWVVRNNRRGNRQLSDDSPGNIYSAHNRILSNHPLRRPLARSTEKDKFDKIVHNVSEPSPPAAGALSTQTAIPRSDNSAEQRISAPRSLVSGQSEDCSRRTNSPEPRYTRPETHQNLIHISKEHHDRPPLSRDDHTRRDRITQDALPRHGTKPNSGHSAILINGSNSQLSAQENKSLTDH